MKRDILGVVLCGGKSRRMGLDKASLEMRPGVPQLEYALSLLEPFCSKLGVCQGPDGSVERQVGQEIAAIPDAPECAGPMAGVIAALRAAQGRPVLALACDMPLLHRGAIVQLLNRRDPEKIATAFESADGMPEPLCCVYEASCLTLLEEQARSGKSSLRGFLKQASIESVEPAAGVDLANVNDVEGLKAARDRFGSGRQ